MIRETASVRASWPTRRDCGGLTFLFARGRPVRCDAPGAAGADSLSPTSVFHNAASQGGALASGTRSQVNVAKSLSSIAAMSDIERFAFRFARAYRLPARAFGISPTTAFVDVGDGELRAHFGPWRVSTPLANITDVAVTGPYAFLKTAGPARLAITDRGLTFATNGDRGVLISFRTPVRGLDPLGILRHPELTVTVAEVDRLAELLHARSECAGAGN